MEKLEQTINEAEVELNQIQGGSENEKISDEQLAEFSVLQFFDKEKLKVLIDKVIIYGESDIEIVWKVDNPFETGKNE